MIIDKEDYGLLVSQVEPGFELIGLIGYFERKGLSTEAAGLAALRLYELYGTLSDLDETTSNRDGKVDV